MALTVSITLVSVAQNKFELFTIKPGFYTIASIPPIRLGIPPYCLPGLPVICRAAKRRGKYNDNALNNCFSKISELKGNI